MPVVVLGVDLESAADSVVLDMPVAVHSVELEQAVHLVVLDNPVVVLDIGLVAVVAADYYDTPAVGIVVADIVVVAAVGIGTVVVAAADVDSLAADNVDVVGSRLVVGFGSGAELGMDLAHLDSSHSAYLHVAATENRIRRSILI